MMDKEDLELMMEILRCEGCNKSSMIPAISFNDVEIRLKMCKRHYEIVQQKILQEMCRF